MEEGGVSEVPGVFAQEASVPKIFVHILVSVNHVVWEKSEMPLLHLHELVSPVDLSFLGIYCGPIR